MISLIVAHDKNRIVGNSKTNSMPWHIPADLKYFKEVTQGHAILMGSKTFESIGRPLPNRHNFILTRDTSKYDTLRGCYPLDSIEEFSEWLNEEEIFIIGGASVYEQFIPYADKLYITEIDHEFEGDVYFPEFDKNQFELKSITHKFKGEDTPYDLKFKVYNRI